MRARERRTNGSMASDSMMPSLFLPIRMPSWSRTASKAENGGGRPLDWLEELCCCWWHTPSGMRERMKSFASSRPEKPRGRSANDMTKIVRNTLADIRLSAKQKRRLHKLPHRPHSEIDLSRLPLV